MKLNNLSNSIYVINLKERLDRKEHITTQLKKIDCENYILFEGVNGKSVENPTRMPSGMFGLIKTYLNMYNDWKKNPQENILIIEDDCVFVDGFNKKLEEYITLAYSSLPPDMRVNQYEATNDPEDSLQYRWKIKRDTTRINLHRFMPIFDENKL